MTAAAGAAVAGAAHPPPDPPPHPPPHPLQPAEATAVFNPSLRRKPLRHAAGIKVQAL
jgi:hypothetical protein